MDIERKFSEKKEITGRDAVEVLVLGEIATSQQGLSLSELNSPNNEKLQNYIDKGFNVADVIDTYLYFGMLEYQAITGKFVYTGDRDKLQENLARVV